MSTSKSFLDEILSVPRKEKGPRLCAVSSAWTRIPRRRMPAFSSPHASRMELGSSWLRLIKLISSNLKCNRNDLGSPSLQSPVNAFMTRLALFVSVIFHSSFMKTIIVCFRSWVDEWNRSKDELRIIRYLLSFSHLRGKRGTGLKFEVVKQYYFNNVLRIIQMKLIPHLSLSPRAWFWFGNGSVGFVIRLQLRRR